MAPTEREPLLEREREDEVATTTSEDAPLLVDEQDEHSETDEHDGSPRRRSKWSLWSSSRSRRTEGDDKDGSRRCRWPSIVAMVILVLLAIAALLVGFLVPGAVKTYAENAAVIEPTALSVESITADGIQARIQANFRLDGSKVDDTNARRIGRLATGIMRKLETEETRVDVYLPTYDNALLGSAVIPPITIDIVDGHTTTIDIVTDLSPGAPESIRSVANDWLEGRLGQLRVTGATDLKIKSGLIPLGTHNVRESLVFEGNDVPSMPEYNIDSINFHDIPLGGRHGQKAVGANVTITAHNDYPVSFEVPPLGFAVLVPNCDASLPYIPVAEAVTEMIHVQGKSDVSAIGLGVVREIPDTLVKTCPRSDSSPLDHFMEHYLHGEDARIFVRGRKIPDSDTPEWISDILESITVPLEFPGQSFGNRIREFSLTEVDFKLPSPFADPGDPDAVPRVSGTIGVLAVLPDQLSNMDVGVNSIRSTADLIYEGDKLGELNLNEWQPANSTKFKDEGDTLLNVTSRVVDVPLTITNGSVFSDVISRMFFGGEDIFLGVQAAVDAKVGTVLGDLALKGVPANGTIPVKGSFCLQDVELTSRKGIPTDILGNIAPRIEDLRILNTSETGVSMQAKINFTNPTQYTATIPFLNVHILGDDVIIGEATAQGIHLELGNNTGNIVHATWDPARFGGKKAQEAAQSLLSGYLSGKNTTLGVRTHRGSVPTMPLLGEALSNLNITVPTPRLGLPGDGDSGGDGDGDGPAQRFIRDATFHVFSSSATFTLASPLHHDLIYIEAINATAYYNHTEPVGQIVTHDPFPAPPGLSQTPRLPVRWSADKIGYDKLRAALGGGLKLDAVADVTVRIGKWVETIHYTGKGIGAKVRI